MVAWWGGAAARLSSGQQLQDGEEPACNKRGSRDVRPQVGARNTCAARSVPCSGSRTPQGHGRAACVADLRTLPRPHKG